VFDHISKQFEVHKKCSATRRIFNCHLAVQEMCSNTIFLGWCVTSPCLISSFSKKPTHNDVKGLWRNFSQNLSVLCYLRILIISSQSKHHQETWCLMMILHRAKLRILLSIQTKPGNHSLFEHFVLTLDAKELLNQLDDYWRSCCFKFHWKYCAAHQVNAP